MNGNKITCTRLIEWDMGHRVLGHQGKCIHPHGHRYKAELTAVAPDLNELGMVIDFGDLKRLIGSVVDQNWDHGFMVSCQDTEMKEAFKLIEQKKLIVVQYNPTAENIALDLMEQGNGLLMVAGSNIRLSQVKLWETPNCFATVINEEFE